MAGFVGENPKVDPKMEILGNKILLANANIYDKSETTIMTATKSRKMHFFFLRCEALSQKLLAKDD